MYKPVYVFLIFLCLISSLSQGQAPFRFEHLTVNDGLSQSQAYCMLQDSYGYLWIGTQEGLNRFDGYEFKVYKNNPFDSTTLTHNWVWAIEEDQNHDLWIGTFQGLCRYKRKEDQFEQYYSKPGDAGTISGNRSNYILRDKKDRLWISAWGAGVNLYDFKTKKFTRFVNDSTDVNSISSNSVRTLYEDRDGNIWVGTWDAGLNKVTEDQDGIHFRRYRANAENGFEISNRITSITEDATGKLWIANYESGLLQFDRQTNIFTRVPDFISDDVNKVITDSRGNVWIGSNSGLSFADQASGQITRFLHDPTNLTGISSNTIYSIYEDRSGAVWFSGNGLDIYNPEKNVFKSFTHQSSNPNSLSQSLVWSFCEDEEGKIWIGTEAGPLNVFDPKNSSFNHVTVTDAKGNIAQNVRKIAYRDGVFWLATFGSGLVRYEKNTGNTRFLLGNHPSILGKIPLISEVEISKDGTLWISTNEQGLLHYDPATEQVEQFTIRPGDATSIGANFVNTVTEDTKNNIWVGFWGGGLSRYDKSTQVFKTYRYDRKNPKGLSDQVVISIFQENDSIFWVCTHTGLNKLNAYTDKITHYFEKDGLPNNVVYAVLKDESGYLWVSTNQGLSRFDPVNNKFKNFTARDGLQGNEFNSNSALKSSTGDFYFGGIDGFTVFRPEKIKDDTSRANLVINSFKIFDKEQAIVKDLVLDHNQNYVSFHFTAIEFSSPEKILYKYMLEGADKNWVDAGNLRSANYTNLDAGHYKFRVRASNADGYWNSKESSFEFVIRPPFWKTWWFVVLIALVFMSVFYSIHRYRLAQSLKVERLRNKIASDLHDEVGSSLTRISIYSDLLQNGTEEQQGKNYLKSISEMSREIVSTMSDIVWSIDNRNDSTGALIIRMKDFANEVLQTKNIELSFMVKGIDENRTLDPALKQNIYLIFKESINNIVKHAKATRVSVSILNQGGMFFMQIQDDGHGFLQTGTQKGNGLRNMNRRAQAIGGTFEIVQSSGTSITVSRKAL